jgi:hypothetical protein
MVILPANLDSKKPLPYPTVLPHWFFFLVRAQHQLVKNFDPGPAPAPTIFPMVYIFSLKQIFKNVHINRFSGFYINKLSKSSSK